MFFIPLWVHRLNEPIKLLIAYQSDRRIEFQTAFRSDQVIFLSAHVIRFKKSGNSVAIMVIHDFEILGRSSFLFSILIELMRKKGKLPKLLIILLQVGANQLGYWSIVWASADF